MVCVVICFKVALAPVFWMKSSDRSCTLHRTQSRTCWHGWQARRISMVEHAVSPWVGHCRSSREGQNSTGIGRGLEEYLGRSDAVAQKRLLRCIRTGRPAGSDHFVKLIENLTRRDLRLRKAGRPLKVS